MYELAVDSFKAKLALCGMHINCAELDAGIRADGDLWKDFTLLYNDANINEFGVLIQYQLA